MGGSIFYTSIYGRLEYRRSKYKLILINESFLAKSGTYFRTFTFVVTLADLLFYGFEVDLFTIAVKPNVCQVGEFFNFIKLCTGPLIPIFDTAFGYEMHR